MKYKEIKYPAEISSRNVKAISQMTGNIFETINIMSKRANQISVDIKQELTQKLEEFSSSQDNLEEIFENREQIEVSKFFENLPKPSSIAIEEFVEDKVFFKYKK